MDGKRKERELKCAESGGFLWLYSEMPALIETFYRLLSLFISFTDILFNGNGGVHFWFFDHYIRFYGHTNTHTKRYPRNGYFRKYIYGSRNAYVRHGNVSY